MNLSNEGIAEIFSHEGIIPYRYTDSVGVATWGVGHTHHTGNAPDPRGLPFGKEYPLSQVIEVFRKDIRQYEKRVQTAVKVPLKQYQYDALVSFDFNTGGVARAELTKSINRGDMDKAADQFMAWVKPPEIRPRRRKEQTLFSTGRYSSGGMALLAPASSGGTPLYKKGKQVNVMAAMGSISAANAHDDKADAAKKGAAATGGGAVASGGGSQMPDLPVDSTTAKVFLVLLGVALLGLAIRFAFKARASRNAAIEANNKAADQIKASLNEVKP